MVFNVLVFNLLWKCLGVMEVSWCYGSEEFLCVCACVCVLEVSDKSLANIIVDNSVKRSGKTSKHSMRY